MKKLTIAFVAALVSVSMAAGCKKKETNKGAPAGSGAMITTDAGTTTMDADTGTTGTTMDGGMAGGDTMGDGGTGTGDAGTMDGGTGGTGDAGTR